MRRFPILVIVVVATLLVLTALIEAREAARPTVRGTPGRTVIFALPFEEARKLPTGALALGVYPESRDATRFVEEIGYGIPPRTPGRPARPDTLMNAWRELGTDVAVFTDPAAAGTPPSALARALPGARDAASVDEALGAEVSVLIVPTAASASSPFEQVRDRRILVLGVGARTPVWISASTAPGTLAGGIARRAAIATPYDLTATLVLERSAVRRTAGSVMYATSAQGEDPKRAVDRLAARLDESERGEIPINIVGTVVGMLLVIGATVWMWRGGTLPSARSAAAASALPLGFMFAELLPGPWPARAVLIPVLAAVAAVLPERGMARRTGIVLLATSMFAIVLAIAAAVFPDGPIAWGVWGNPLNSWRFFGMRNHFAAFAIGSAIAGLLILDVRGPRAAGTFALVGFVVGAAVFGANFVGVGILGVGATMALLVRRYGEVRARPLLWAFLVGGAAFGLALLLDLRAPISHGGRALRSVGTNGLEAALQLLAARVRLNEADISQFGIFGWIAFAAAIVATAGLFDWASRTPNIPAHVRGAVAGGSLAGLIAFIAEDSGFFTGAILGLFPWIVFMLWRTLPAYRPLDPARADEVSPPF